MRFQIVRDVKTGYSRKMKAKYDYDVIIVGAGPAGSAAAALCAGKHKVLLAERRVKSIRKECGGRLSTHAQTELGRLGITVPGHVLTEPQLYAVRAFDLDSGLSRLYEKHYVNIDREAFDLHLRDIAVSAGADLKEMSFVTAEERDGMVEALFHENGREVNVRAGALCGADGACSRVRGTMFPKVKKANRYIAMQQHIRLKEEPGYFPVFFDSPVTDFYGWIIPKKEYAVLGVSLPENDAANRFEIFKEHVKKITDFTETGEIRGSFLLRPKVPGEIFAGKGRIALLGEAAGFISPSSSEGVSYALKSAQAFAMAMESANPVRTYGRRCRSIRFDVLSKSLKQPVMYNKKLRKAAFLSGVMSLGK